jgi:peptide/nickel transport system permease protein
VLAKERAIAALRFIVGRAAYVLTLWVGVIVLAFALFHLAPTDPARVALGAHATEEQVANFRAQHGLDQPVPQQFLRYVSGLARLDLGESYVDRRPVAPEVATRLGVTLQLAATASVLILLWTALSFQLASSRVAGRALRSVEFLFLSLPTLFSGVIIALATVQFYPFTRFAATGGASDLLFFLPPAVVLALYPAGALGRIVQQQHTVLMRSDMVRAARARGLADSGLRWRYLVRNSAIPLTAAFANQLPLLITSSFIVEIIFSVPGIGVGLLNAVMQRDLPMVEGIVVTTSMVTILITRLFDLLYPLIDPRIDDRPS